MKYLMFILIFLIPITLFADDIGFRKLNGKWKNKDKAVIENPTDVKINYTYISWAHHSNCPKADKNNGVGGDFIATGHIAISIKNGYTITWYKHKCSLCKRKYWFQQRYPRETGK